ncbi:TIGR04222 domain-containing membrane protein [Actinomycetes bacterium KLBMP 9759]
MKALAATGDTWGIDGTTFLVAYVVLAAVVLVAAVRKRAALADPVGKAPLEAGDIVARPHDLAYLNGGRDLAVVSALSSLRLAGAITSKRGNVKAVPRVDPGSDLLERVLYKAATARQSRSRLSHLYEVSHALNTIEGRLVAAGLLLSPAQRSAIRRVGVWMLAVAGFGLVRLLAGVAEARPVGFLLLALGAAAVVALVLMVRAPVRSAAGDRLLARMRAEHEDLSPSMQPDWHVYGPAGAVLGIGLFGTSAMWASDPAMAEEFAVQRASSFGGGDGYAGGSGGSCGSGDGGGGGGGCGGGGCGG